MQMQGCQNAFEMKRSQLEIIIYRKKLLYKNFMVTTNQKPIIDAHTKTIKEYKQSSKDNDQIMRERTKERNKKDYKHALKINRIAIIICVCSVTRSYLTFCNPMNCSPPGFSVHEISQAIILEWVAISFSRRSS